jgi:hypothetical protein
MRHTFRTSVVNGLLAAAVAALLVSFPPASGAEGSGTANGKVSAVDAASITVRVGEADLSFSVDADTSVTAPTGVHAKGPRPKRGVEPVRAALDEQVKVGQIVQVVYDAEDMRATKIRALPLMPQAR